MEQENKEKFLETMVGTLGSILLRNLLSGKGFVRAGSGNKKGKGTVRTGYGKEWNFQCRIIL